MTRPIVAVAAAVALVVSGCSDNGSAEPSSTTVAPSTVASTSAPATTTTTSTAPATTTTTSAEQALEAEKAKIEAAYRAVAAAHLDALTALDGYDPATIRAVIAPGPQLDAELKYLSDFRAKGRRVKPNNPDSTRNLVESTVLASVDATTASIVVCESNNSVVYEPGSSPGPDDDVIVDDSQAATRVRWDMVKEDGKWLGGVHTTLGSWPGASECPPA